MGETRDRGVLASAECIQQLKEAQARQRNAEGKVWTLTDISIESGVHSRTVARFLNQESKVDETTAIAICQTLGVKFEAENNPQDTEIESDRTGQLSMNPFIFGDPVPPEKFYGRQQAILEVKNRIGANRVSEYQYRWFAADWEDFTIALYSIESDRIYSTRTTAVNCQLGFAKQSCLYTSRDRRRIAAGNYAPAGEGTLETG
jgi:transcriptional regulator with XRE-family HTH domain